MRLNLDKALKKARKGSFVSNVYFSEDESLHYWNGNYYYEDGAIVTEEFLSTQDWANRDSWFVLASRDKVDSVKLDSMHLEANGCMLRNGSYMDSILTD